MEIYLDDEPYQVDQSASPTVGLVLDEVLKQVRAGGRIVAAIRCDGVEVDSDDLQRVLGEPTDTYARLDFVSGSAGDLVIEALSRIQAMLMELGATKDEAVEKLSQGQTSEGMALLGPYFDAWRQAHEAVLQSARLVGLDLTAVSVDDVPMVEVFSQFAEQLRQLKTALEANDHVTLSDILSYEADATTERWIKLIDLVKEASLDR
jgi:hypothetical protein